MSLKIYAILSEFIKVQPSDITKDLSIHNCETWDRVRVSMLTGNPGPRPPRRAA